MRLLPLDGRRRHGESAAMRDPATTEERSIGFRVRDATGSLRVFPRGARFDAPVRFDVETDLLGDDPPDSTIRHGGSTRPAEIDEAAAAAALLTVDPRVPAAPAGLAVAADGGRTRSRGSSREIRSRSSAGHSPSPISQTRPARISAAPRIRSVTTRRSPPTSPRRGPTGRSSTTRPRPGATPRSPASGSGGRSSLRPSTRPRTRSRSADAEAAARAERTFRIAPETLVLAASDEVPLLIAYGAARGRRRSRPGPLRARTAGCDPGHRVGDGLRREPRRGRFVSAPEAAAASPSACSSRSSPSSS